MGTYLVYMCMRDFYTVIMAHVHMRLVHAGARLVYKIHRLAQVWKKIIFAKIIVPTEKIFKFVGDKKVVRTRFKAFSWIFPII